MSLDVRAPVRIAHSLSHALARTVFCVVSVSASRLKPSLPARHFPFPPSLSNPCPTNPTSRSALLDPKTPSRSPHPCCGAVPSRCPLTQGEQQESEGESESAHAHTEERKKGASESKRGGGRERSTCGGIQWRRSSARTRARPRSQSNAPSR
eukprot:2401177-Rhodomonas_salina.1